ncbi:MAG TPA: DUF1194 domain-containing protein [Azospirillum sp.]|nr:DUF1194 domain-containing protein [Azospirillum sp.]
MEAIRRRRYDLPSSGNRTMLLRAFVVLLLSAVLALPAGAAPKAKDTPQVAPPVGLELVLAVDGSASISEGALEFQLRGHAAAFRDPAVIAAASATRIAVTLVAYSGPGMFRVLVPWTTIGSAEQAEAFAKRVQDTPRDGRADSTAIGSAIDACAAQFAKSGVNAPRKVIDLVSNGFSNSGTPPAEARDRAAARGITVNALVILDEYDWLEEYFQENVVGGPGAFVRTAESRDSFAEALRQKLILEIAGVPVRYAMIR